MLTYIQAIVLGIIQGVTEIFPVSSLGHSVLIANLFGWHDLGVQLRANQSPLLALTVMTQLAVGLALLVFYRAEWIRIGKGFYRSFRTKNLTTDSDAKLAWLLVAATVPAALIALVIEHGLRHHFATAFFAMFLVILNGVLLIRGDERIVKAEVNRPRRRRQGTAVKSLEVAKTTRVASDHLTFGRAIYVGVMQLWALFPGISRTGITMLAGLKSGLSHQDAARFSFLLITPILLLGVLFKLPGAMPQIHGSVTGPILVGSILAGIAAYISVRYLDKYFRTKSLRPFGWYCIGLGLFMLLISIIHGAA